MDVFKILANGKAINTTQEMLAVGVTNIVASFVQGLPASASVVRAVVNNAAGVQTTLAGAVAGGVSLSHNRTSYDSSCS